MPTSHLLWQKNQKYGHGNAELTEEESYSVFTSSSFWNARSGLPWPLYIIHSFSWMSHKRNNCHINININININIVLLEPAQAAKEHRVSAGSILTHQLVNSRAQLQSQSQSLHCAGHCSPADSLQPWPCSTRAPSPSPGWAHIQQLPVTHPSPSVSRSAAWQHHDSTTSRSPSLL